jgi:N6-L-threonylcarbamoyladenine synthase
MSNNIFMLILGIETSCDDSAAAIVFGHKEKVKSLSNVISSQIGIHQKYGGVVPEVAAREHLIQLLPTIEQAIKKARVKKEDIDAIAVTKGPGLVSSLLSGIETAKVLSLIWQKPLIAINHLSGHIYANFLDGQKINFPLISLIVSGGHTSLIFMPTHHQFEIIGETLDDAAGEAYDKGAQMLGLDYPGGPIIEKLAKEGKNNDYIFPRPMLQSKDLNFSFSGLKTSLYYKLKNDKNWKNSLKKYCYSYQEAIIDVLLKKSQKAINNYKVKSFLLSGGVAANTALRQRLEQNINTKFYAPKIAYTTDNAAMIASSAYYLYKTRKEKAYQDYKSLEVDPNLKLS